MPDFLPSQVQLVVPPLAGTMGRAEVEFAAALIVRACQVLGDRWQPISWKQSVEAFKADRDAGREFGRLMENPVFRPDAYDLVKRGFAQWGSTRSGEGDTVELTDKGFECMRRWVLGKKGTGSKETGART